VDDGVTVGVSVGERVRLGVPDDVGDRVDVRVVVVVVEGVGVGVRDRDGV